jgi:hypothetical protein
MEPQNTESLDDQIEQTEDVKLSSEPSEKIKTDLS